MDPATFLALFDAALTIVERGPEVLAKFRAEGLITVEEQEQRLARVARSRARVGLPPAEPYAGDTPSSPT